MNQRERYNQGGIGRWYWDYRDREVIKYVKGELVLDVGCGDGITTAKIPGAIGIDPANGSGSAYSLPYWAKEFETVLLLEVIEHLKRPIIAIQEIRRVLVPGGRIIILFPHDSVFKLAWFLAGMWGEIGQDRGHLWRFTPSEVRRLLVLCGFKTVSEQSIPVNCWPLALHHIIVGEKC